MTEPVVFVGEVVPAANGAGITASGDQLYELIERWLGNRRLAENTRHAYRRDVQLWLAWCAHRPVDPLLVRFTHVNDFARWLERAPDDVDELPYVRRPAAPSTVARRLSALSSWYAFAVRLGLVAANPVSDTDRPRVDRDYSATEAFSSDEATRMLEYAGDDPVLGAGTCGPAVLTMLIEIGMRVSEVCHAQLVDRRFRNGQPAIELRTKGGKKRLRLLPPGSVHELGIYLRSRAAAADVRVEQLTGTMFLRPDGRPLDRATIARYVRRVAAAAGLPNAARISPHSCRHAWSRIAKAQGAPLEDRQDALGHADPRTTRRYDRTGQLLDNDPSQLVFLAMQRASYLRKSAQMAAMEQT